MKLKEKMNNFRLFRAPELYGHLFADLKGNINFDFFKI